MHTEMWTHPATVANVATLRARGVVVVDPAVGRLTGADSGAGRLPDAEHIEALADLLLPRSRRAAPRPGRAAASSSPPAAPASRSTRSGSSATGRPAGRATPSRWSPPPAAPR